MSAWIPAIPIVAIAAALIFIPGWVVARGLKFVGLEAFGLAPALSTAICGGFGVICGAIGIPWSPLTFAAVSAISVAAAYALRTLPAFRRSGTSTRAVHGGRRFTVFATLSIAAAALLGSYRLVGLYGSPENIAQVFDNVFHLNAIRFIIETGNASSLTLASFQGNSGFEALYPAAWHTFAAMIVQVSGCDLQVAENVLNLVIGALVWPVSCVFFVRAVISRHPVATFSAAILSVAQISFPFLVNVWGPLFPFAFAVSLLPVALAIVSVLMRGTEEAGYPRAPWVIALVLVVGGMGTAHMSSLNTLIALAAPLLILAWWTYLRSFRTWSWQSKQAWCFTAVTILTPLLVLISWTKVRPAPYDNWGPTVRSGAALGEVLTNSTMQESAAWIISILVVAGAAAGFREKKHRWLIAAYAVAGALYIVDAAWSKGFWRDLLTGTWYQDTYRLAALLPIVVTPLAAYGTLALWRQSLIVISRRLPETGRVASASAYVCTVMAISVVGAAAMYGPVGDYISRTKAVYSLDASSAILSKEEFTLAERLSEHVPKGVKIADNPWNGSSWAYAFGDRDVLTPHLFASPDPDRITISQHLKDAASDPAVCEALHNQNVEYVLDFGSRYLLDLPPSADYPGVTDIGNRPGFQEVDSEGPAAKLYKITACGNKQ